VISHLTEGFLLGITTGTTCLATCGPIYAPYLMQYERNWWRAMLALMEISAGRFITYAGVGIIAGLLGSTIAEVNRDLFTAIAYILFSVFLLVTTFRTNKKDKCCTTGKWSSFVDRPVILGILTGINFCPSFLLAATSAIDSSGPMGGFYLFASFFVGTTIFLLPVSFFGMFGIKRQLRLIARIAAVVISVWFLTQAGIQLHKYYDERIKTESIDPKLIVNLLDSTATYIVTDDTLAQKQLQSAFSKAKNMSVPFISLKDSLSLPLKGTFIIGQELAAGRHIENHFMRTSGRFVLILPDSTNVGYSHEQCNHIIEHLRYYHFKIDPDSGTIYQLPEGKIK
jgi:sulfite exporter TauE/SafE